MIGTLPRRPMPKQHAWLSLIETGYDVAGSESEWLHRVVDAATPIVGNGAHLVAWTYRCTPTTLTLEAFPSGTNQLLEWFARMSHRLSTPKSLDLTYREGHVVETASHLVFPRLPDMQRMFVRLVRGFARDLLVIDCHTGQEHGVCIGALLRHVHTPTPVERKRWPQAAAHLAAALRLRKAVARLTADDAAVEAVLDSHGRVHHAKEDAAPVDARESLRHAVRNIERARAMAGEADVDGSLDRWEGLVRGRWTLVDHFDTDGRRFIVAVPNDPRWRDPRGLTRRERQVAEFVGRGRTTREIAYTLGISDAAVANNVMRAQRKLRLSTRAELVAFFAQNGLRRRMAEVAVAGERLLVGAYPLIDSRRAQGLTAAEQAVVALLIAGSTVDHIARERGTSPHTVAAQVQAVYRKLGVTSCAQLAARLQAES